MSGAGRDEDVDVDDGGCGRDVAINDLHCQAGSSSSSSSSDPVTEPVTAAPAIVEGAVIPSPGTRAGEGDAPSGLAVMTGVDVEGGGGVVSVVIGSGANNDNRGPTAIPDDGCDDLRSVGVPTCTDSAVEGHDGNDGNDHDNDDNDGGDVGEESDYSYDYEEEDETQYSGFLIPTEPLPTAAESPIVPSVPSNVASVASAPSALSVPAVPWFEAAEAPAAVSGDLVADVSVIAVSDNPNPNRLSDKQPSNNPNPNPNTHEGDSHQPPSHNPPKSSLSSSSSTKNKSRWREPTPAAVHMSLRAERETTGGRRRLASDLYRIMAADTKKAGFSLEPCDEDSMDKWAVRLFGFDEDSNLAKDMLVAGNDAVELEMTFPDQYPFEPPFVRVVRPRFKRQTGFVMNGALCMELLTNEGWNPINDIESVIVSVRSLMVVGDGRLQAAADMGKEKWGEALKKAQQRRDELLLLAQAEAAEKNNDNDDIDDDNDNDDNNTDHDEEESDSTGSNKRKREAASAADGNEGNKSNKDKDRKIHPTAKGGSYSAAEARAAYSHLSDYHKSKGWDRSGWWTKKG